MRKLCLLFLVLFLLPPLCPAENRADEKGRFLDAVALYGKGDFDAAAQLLDSLYQGGAASDAVCYYLGLSEAGRGQVASAQKRLEEAVSRDSLNTWYLSALASVYEMGEHWLSLALTCERLIQLDSAHFAEPFFYAKTGNAFSQARDTARGILYLDKALAIVPDMPMALYNRAGLALIDEDYEGFFDYAGRLLQTRELDADWKQKYLQSMLSAVPPATLETWKGPLLQLCAQAVAAHPEHLGLHVFRQSVAYVVKDYPEAIAEAEQIIALSGDDADTRESMTQLIGDAYMEMGDEKRCFAAYEKVLKMNPDNIATLNNYAYSLALAGKNLGKALKMSEKTLAADPKNLTYLDTYGWILHRMGRNEKAKEIFKEAMIYGGRQEKVILSHYAAVLQALGEADLARYYESLSAQ